MTGDTATIAFGMGTFAARTAVNAGSSAHLAAIEVAKKLKLAPRRHDGGEVRRLELRDGFALCHNAPEAQHFRERLSRPRASVSMAGGLSPGIEHTSYFTPDQSTYSNGTHVAEVEVDVETGEVKILRYIVMHDCGNVINPMVVKGQVEGGLAHGVGNALFERMIYDDNAQPVNVNFGEYLLPGSTDVPRVELHHMETPSPLNPIGVKGAGEGGTIPAIAAIIAAVENALSPFKVKISEAPISPIPPPRQAHPRRIQRPSFPRRSEIRRPPAAHRSPSRVPRDVFGACQFVPVEGTIAGASVRHGRAPRHREDALSSTVNWSCRYFASSLR